MNSSLGQSEHNFCKVSPGVQESEPKFVKKVNGHVVPLRGWCWVEVMVGEAAGRRAIGLVVAYKRNIHSRSYATRIFVKFSPQRRRCRPFAYYWGVASRRGYLFASGGFLRSGSQPEIIFNALPY